MTATVLDDFSTVVVIFTIEIVEFCEVAGTRVGEFI